MAAQPYKAQYIHIRLHRMATNCNFWFPDPTSLEKPSIVIARGRCCSSPIKVSPWDLKSARGISGQTLLLCSGKYVFTFTHICSLSLVFKYSQNNGVTGEMLPVSWCFDVFFRSALGWMHLWMKLFSCPYYPPLRPFHLYVYTFSYILSWLQQRIIRTNTHVMLSLLSTSRCLLSKLEPTCGNLLVSTQCLGESENLNLSLLSSSQRRHQHNHHF